MSIKIVYNGRTHKLSAKVQTYDELLKSIKSLYPEQLAADISLYITLNPNQPPFKILDEMAFERTKVIYKQCDLQAMKFLVKDSIHPDLTEADINVLNQSIIIKSGQQFPNIDEIMQPQQQQQQPFKIQQQPDLNLNQFVQDLLVKSDIQGDKIDYQSTEFQEFIIQQIDNRLTSLGLLKPQQSIFKLKLLQLTGSPITVGPKQKFNISFTLQNTGNCNWDKDSVRLICLTQQYNNISFQIPKTTAPNAFTIIQFELVAPELPQEYQIEFRMANINKGVKEFFGLKLIAIVKVQGEIKGSHSIKQQDAQSSQTQVKNAFQDKANQLVQCTGINDAEALEFVKIFAPDFPVDQIINAYLDQK